MKCSYSSISLVCYNHGFSARAFSLDIRINPQLPSEYFPTAVFSSCEDGQPPKHIGDEESYNGRATLRFDAYNSVILQK